MNVAIAKIVCSHCSVPTLARELGPGGLCLLCFEAEGPPVEPITERRAVTTCRSSGLRAVARPCLDGVHTRERPAKCQTCRAILDAEASSRTTIATTPKKDAYERSESFTSYDAEMLKRFFSKPAQMSIGRDGSTMGAMMERLEEGTNRNTTEKPRRTEPRCPICAGKLRAGIPGTKLKIRSGAPRLTRGRRARSVSRITGADLLDVVMGASGSAATAAVASPEFVESEPASEIITIPPPTPLTEAEVHQLASPLTSTHTHTRTDRQALKPIRVYDKELPNGQLVQVQVMPPSLEPHTYESHRIDVHGTIGIGKYGAWDDEATQYVAGRVASGKVGRILGRLSRRHLEVLEARYSTHEEQSSSNEKIREMAAVIMLTKAAQSAHHKLAEAGTVGTVRNAILELTQKAVRKNAEGTSAVDALALIRAEATELVREAEAAYARAAVQEEA